MPRELAYFRPEPSAQSSSRRAVVLYLHGSGDNLRHILGEGVEPAASAQWLRVAAREHFVVLFPLGSKAPGWRAKAGWNDYRLDVVGNPEADDVTFLSRFMEYAVDELHGDRRRIYVTGMSNGGHMAMKLAMEMPEAIAAVAPVAALLPVQCACEPPSIPVPILMMHGTKDPIAPFEGGAMAGDRGEVHSAHTTRAMWSRWNGLDGVDETTRELPDRDRSDNSTVLVHARTAAALGRAVVAYEIRGGGHTEPSQAARTSWFLRRIQGSQNHDIEMAEEVWKFFEGRSR